MAQRKIFFKVTCHHFICLYKVVLPDYIRNCSAMVRLVLVRPPLLKKVLMFVEVRVRFGLYSNQILLQNQGREKMQFDDDWAPNRALII